MFGVLGLSCSHILCASLVDWTGGGDTESFGTSNLASRFVIWLIYFFSPNNFVILTRVVNLEADFDIILMLFLPSYFTGLNIMFLFEVSFLLKLAYVYLRFTPSIFLWVVSAAIEASHSTCSWCSLCRSFSYSVLNWYSDPRTFLLTYYEIYWWLLCLFPIFWFKRYAPRCALMFLRIVVYFVKLGLKTFDLAVPLDWDAFFAPSFDYLFSKN